MKLLPCALSLIAPAFTFAFALSACSSDSSGDSGVPADTGVHPDAAEGTPDSGANPDAAAPDAMEGDGGLPMGVAPPRRGDMAAAIDPATQRIVMFFGDRAEPMNCGQAASDFMNDGWTFDPTTERWAQLEIAGGGSMPMIRARSNGAWDAMRSRFILFGGRFRMGSTMNPYTFLKDVWAFDLATATWTELSAQTRAGGPTGRMNATVVADPAQDRIIIHGGGTTDFTSFMVDGATWAFNFADNSWTRIGQTMPPPARLFHMAALDEMRRRMYVFGGGGADALTTGMFMRDLWYLDLDADTWHQIPTDASFPRGRIKGTMEYDEARDRLVLFGGHDDGMLGNDNDVWTFDLAAQTWTRQIEGDTFNRLFPGEPFCDFPADFANVDLMSPERRESHLFVVQGELAFMYGGRTDCGLTNDTWVLDLSTLLWRQITQSFNGMTCFRSGRQDCSDPNAKKCG